MRFNEKAPAHSPRHARCRSAVQPSRASTASGQPDDDHLMSRRQVIRQRRFPAVRRPADRSSRPAACSMVFCGSACAGLLRLSVTASAAAHRRPQPRWDSGSQDRQNAAWASPLQLIQRRQHARSPANAFVYHLIGLPSPMAPGSSAHLGTSACSGSVRASCSKARVESRQALLDRGEAPAASSARASRMFVRHGVQGLAASSWSSPLPSEAPLMASPGLLYQLGLAMMASAAGDLPRNWLNASRSSVWPWPP